MNLIKQKFADDEIDISEIILTFWREKFLILAISLTFRVTSYIYSNSKLKAHETIIAFRKISNILFKNIDSSILYNNKCQFLLKKFTSTKF